MRKELRQKLTDELLDKTPSLSVWVEEFMSRFNLTHPKVFVHGDSRLEVMDNAIDYLFSLK